MKKKIKVSFQTSSKRDFLPPIRVNGKTKKQILSEAESEGLCVSQYLRSCIFVGRRKKGYDATA